MERPLNDRNAADTNRVPQFESICNLKPGSQNLNLQVVVLDCVTKYTSKEKHEIRIFKVADKTGSINMCVYDEVGALLQPGDICRLTRCYAMIHKGHLILYIGRTGKLHKIGDFCALFSETPNMSDLITGNRPNISFEGGGGGGGGNPVTNA